MFEIVSDSQKLRRGKIQTKNGAVSTPFFMPIATKGSVKHITPEEIKKIGYEVVLGNTYHLWLRPGNDLIKQVGGLGPFMNWDRAILTDSGGFQVFSLGARAKERFGASGVELTEKEVRFIDHLNGASHKLSPEKSIDIQLDLDSDMIMCLDDCPPYPCDRETAKKSLELTTRWATRCKRHFMTRVGDKNKTQLPMLFGIVQGSVYEDLRKESAEQLLEIGFDGYAIGGVAVGEPREKLHEILDWVMPLLPEDKTRYLMGLGKPEEIVAAVHQGVDMFDCVIPTREGRHGRIFVWEKTAREVSDEKLLKLKDSFYSTINITNEKYKKDFSSIDDECSCYACANYSKAYIKHLLSVNEPFGYHLASLHNLTFYFELMEKLRS